MVDNEKILLEMKERMSRMIDPAQDRFGLYGRISANLSHRLTTNTTYRAEEIADIESIEIRLIPREVALDEETQERLRALARLSRPTLTDPSRITSHRRFIGPVIVMLKKLTWPFIRAQLKGVFEGIEEFNSLMLETVAKECVERKRRIPANTTETANSSPIPSTFTR